MPRNRGRSIVALLVWTLCFAGLPRSADAIQHLVRAGDDWEQFASRANPGDEIILMPGTHRAGTLKGLQGEPGRPIVIRSLQPEKPSVIEGEGYGIRLLDPRHVTVRDLVIRSARVHAVEINGGAAAEDVAGVLLERIRIEHPVEAGERHAVVLRHIDGVSISQCTIEGWSGSAIEIIGAREVTVETSRFRGRESGGELSGVRIRGSSEDVHVTGSRFERCGDQAVSIGGSSAIEDVRSVPTTDTESTPLYEASRIEVSDCVMVDGRSAVAFINCTDAVVRNCAVHRPRRVVLSVRREQVDPRFGDATGCQFEQNLIRWEPGDITSLGHGGGDVSLEGLTLGENLWWTADWETAAESLGPFPGTVAFPQITDVDPAIDDYLRPQAKLALSFGPEIE